MSMRGRAFTEGKREGPPRKASGRGFTAILPEAPGKGDRTYGVMSGLAGPPAPANWCGSAASSMA